MEFGGRERIFQALKQLKNSQRKRIVKVSEVMTEKLCRGGF